jgi:diacylglycerol kinase family enzyme
VVQGLVGTSVAFGVVPLGTVNALASNLGVRFLDKPVGVAALQRLLTYEPVRIPLGEAIGERGTRSFAAMCGCGPDGALAESLAASSPWKRRLGRHSYPVRAAWLFATRRWPAFGVRYRLTALDEWHEVEAVAVLASRVPDLGGAFSSLTSNASMTSDRLHVQIVRPAGRLPGHVALAAWLGMPRFGLRNRLAMSLDVEELRCESLGSVNARAQADAEPMGGLPLTMRVRRDAIWMMMPGGLP